MLPSRAAPLLALSLALLAACKPTHRLAGSYRSTWGRCVVAVQGKDASIAYPRGAMRCLIDDATLRCNWQSGAAQGKAVFREQPDRSLAGTWGNGESDQDGGAWVLVR